MFEEGHEPMLPAWRSISLRASIIFCIWLVVAGLKPADVIAGAIASVVVAWVGLRLLPAGTLRFRPLKLARYAAHFVYQSVAAGIDVARLALHPRMPLQPGFVIYRPQLSPGASLDTFCTVSSLLPGTLPCGADATGGVAIHCLDVTQPVAGQLAEEEALFAETLDKGRDFGQRP
jgi:multicomponent Na+:H+ antiporter subunit E